MRNWFPTRNPGFTGSAWSSARSGRTAEDLHQVPDLIVDLARALDGGGDLLSDEFTVASAQAVDGDSDGALIRVEGGGGIGIRRGVVVAGQVRLEPIEGVGLARKLPFVFKGSGGAIQKGQGPSGDRTGTRGCAARWAQRNRGPLQPASRG